MLEDDLGLKKVGMGWIYIPIYLSTFLPTPVHRQGGH